MNKSARRKIIEDDSLSNIEKEKQLEYLKYYGDDKIKRNTHLTPKKKKRKK